MNALCKQIEENRQEIIILYHILATNAVSKYFADIILNLLVDSLELIYVDAFSTSEKKIQGKRSSALLILCCIMFPIVKLFASKNPELRQHVATIMRKSLTFVTKADDPHAYLQLLLNFFKSVNDAQFEVLYRELYPFIEQLFYDIIEFSEEPINTKNLDLIVVVCFLVLDRPSTIFRYLQHQMKPAVWSLKHPHELRETTTHGLRELEFWIDMRQPSFLDSLNSRV